MKRNLLYILLLILIYSCNHKKEEIKTDAPKSSGNCTYSRDDKNALGKQIRVTEEEKFIALQYEDSSSKALYNGKDFFKGYLSCVNVDTVLGIYFDFIFNTDEAFQYYGTIKKGNKITFVLASGKAVEVPFGATFSGNTNLTNETTEYSSFGYLPVNGAKQLQSEELARVKISWSKKEEEYKVVNPKIFVNQLPCVVNLQ